LIAKSTIIKALSKVEKKSAVKAMQVLSSEEGWEMICKVLEAAAKHEREQVQEFVTEQRGGNGHVIRSKDQVIDFNNRHLARAEAFECVPELVGDILNLVRGNERRM